MRRALKRMAGYLFIPVTRWYLRKERTYRHQQTRVVVEPGVFHPGLFPSTRMLLECMRHIELRNKKVLELGAGTGLLSIVAARAGALVTATDISTRALGNIRRNAQLHGVDLTILRADVFENLNNPFDLILVNPPYYRGAAVSEDSLAWYAGPSLEYFHKFFQGLKHVCHHDTLVWMTLTLDSPLAAIKDLAANAGYTFQTVHEKFNVLDGRDYVFRIIPATTKEGEVRTHTSCRPDLS